MLRQMGSLKKATLYYLIAFGLALLVALANMIVKPILSLLSLPVVIVTFLVLAATGLYGVISYLVAQRTREIGVRMALGAQAWNVIGLVMRQAAGLAGAGIAVGLAGALAFATVLESLLYGVSTRDPLTYAALAALLALVALLATWLPAWRASRLDPLLAIRTE